MRSDGRMNGPARGDGRPNGHRGTGRSFRLCRRWFCAGRFMEPDGWRVGRRNCRCGFDIHNGLELGLSVRNGGRFGVGGGAVLRGGFELAGGWRFGILVPVVAAELVHYVVVQRAGVRLFIRDAQFGELFQYFVSLNFQLPRQLVNSDLSHR
jgi:hypothetical protein